MTPFKKSSIPRQSSYNSLYVNPLNDLKHNRSCSDGGLCGSNAGDENKENAEPNKRANDMENRAPSVCEKSKQLKVFNKCPSASAALKPSSLQLCMKFHEPDSALRLKMWDPIDSSENSNSINVWDFSDSEAAPASSWSTLPNRSLLCRPLPLDIGRCTCVIVKEKPPKGLDGGVLYSLYTNEGQGRQDRKLAVAYHRRRNGRSEFMVAQNSKGIMSTSDDSLIGTITSNLMGSRYHILDQGSRANSLNKKSKLLLAVITFMPTIATWTGSYRSMKVCIAKHQSMLLKSTSQAQHINGLPKDWEQEGEKVQQLFSRVPHYNPISKQYELDFRDRGRAGFRIESSVKNFQLILGANMCLDDLEERQTDNPAAWQSWKIKICDGLQISSDRLPGILYMFGFH